MAEKYVFFLIFWITVITYKRGSNFNFRIWAARHLRHTKLLFFFNETNDLNLDDMWFQQNGATCHATRKTLILLETQFLQRGDIDWPSRSCDLTSKGFPLWSYLKERIYVNKPTTKTSESKEKIGGQLLVWGAFGRHHILHVITKYVFNTDSNIIRLSIQ